MKSLRLVPMVMMILILTGFTSADGGETPICTNSSSQFAPCNFREQDRVVRMIAMGMVTSTSMIWIPG